MASRKLGVNWRLGLVVALIALAALALVARLVQLQIVDHERYAAEARNIHMARETVTGRRGALLDRSGYPLAASKETYDVMAEVKAWVDPVEANRAAAAIAAVTDGDPKEMVAAVQTASIYEIAVARGLGYEEASRVRDLDLPGVRLLRSSARLYPEGNLAAQLIGFVGRDNVGLTGLEADLEGVIGGASGTVVFERDGRGDQIALGDRSELPPLPGSDVVLTIDRFVQRLAEKELDRAIEEHKAGGGTIIVVQPETGEILAMASRPTFDLTTLDLSDEFAPLGICVQDLDGLARDAAAEGLARQRRADTLALAVLLVTAGVIGRDDSALLVEDHDLVPEAVDQVLQEASLLAQLR